MIAGVTLSAALAGCASSGGAASGRNPGLAALPDVPEALIRLQHGSCSPDHCPVYQVSIFVDGTFIYDGLANVAQPGRRTGRLSPQQMNRLLSDIHATGFLDQPEECCICETTDGFHLVVVEYRPGVTQKVLVDDERCVSVPAAVRALEMAIVRETAIARWVAHEAQNRAAAPAGAAHIQYSASRTGDSEITP
jgi:hypothetical protein